MMRWRAACSLSLVCVACSAPPADQPPKSAQLADQSAEFAARAAERRGRELQQLIAIDRQSLQLAERTERAQRSLFDAGRVTADDLQQAVTQVERCRSQLEQHEQELAGLRGAR